MHCVDDLALKCLQQGGVDKITCVNNDITVGEAMFHAFKKIVINCREMGI